MKKVWTVADLVGGIFIVRNSSPLGDSSNLGFKRTVTFKVVYSFQFVAGEYGLCNALTDGHTDFVGSKQDLADYLNGDEYGYRGLTKAEFLEMATEMKQGYDDFVEEYKTK